MTELVVRNLDPILIQKLRERSQQHGHSLEEEVKAILEQSMGAKAAIEGRQVSNALIKLEQAQSQYAGLVFGDSTALVREDRDH